jgi:hypothetical protein
MSASATLPGDWERLQPRLSPSQEALLSAVAGEWAQIVVARGPVDRVAAEAGVRSAYRAAGLEPPETVIWLDSPLAGAVAAGALTGLDIDAVARDQMWDQVRAAFEAQGQRLTPGGAGRPVRSWIGPLVWSEVRVEVEAQLGRQLWALLWERTGLEVVDDSAHVQRAVDHCDLDRLMAALLVDRGQGIQQQPVPIVDDQPPPSQ